MSLKRSVAVIGAAETDTIGVIPDKSMIQLHAEAAYNALRDAGIDKSEVDGVLCARPSPTEVAHYLGITPRFVDACDLDAVETALKETRPVALLVETISNPLLKVAEGKAQKKQKKVPSLQRSKSSRKTTLCQKPLSSVQKNFEIWKRKSDDPSHSFR